MVEFILWQKKGFCNGILSVLFLTLPVLVQIHR
jgi:hypothetical protein